MAEGKVDWKSIHKQEATDYVAKFYRNSYDWRSQSYHPRWDKWERNYFNVYDPTIKAKKLPWQATMFDPMTVTNVEVVSTALTRLLFGKKKPLTVEPREMGDLLQAELHSDLLDFEVEKSGMCLASDAAVKEACIFGSGFTKVYWKKIKALRRVKKPTNLTQKMAGAFKDMLQFRMPTIDQERETLEETYIVDNSIVEKVHIRDIFLEPNTLELNKVLHRDKKITYGMLVKFSDDGIFDKESVKTMEGINEAPSFDEDLKTVMADLGIAEGTSVRVDFDKRHTVFEFWGDIPRKWIDLEMSEDGEENKKKANEMVPGKVMIASGNYFLASEENPMPSLKPPFFKVDYISSGLTYGIGIGQLLEGIQEETNEIRNLRVDNVTLSMNKMFVGIEKAMVDPNEAQSMPGRLVRLRTVSGIDDARKMFSEVPVSDVAISAFRETGELERKAQEVTAANRVTTGSAGLTKDSNQTLGGMELLRQAAFDRFNVYAYRIGKTLLVPQAQMLMELVYQNSSPERYKRILGERPVEWLPGELVARWQLLKVLPYEELCMSYDFKFVDIFGQENKAQKRQALASDMQLTATLIPQWNPRNGLKQLYRYDDFTEDQITEIIGEEQQMIPTPMGMDKGVPSLASPTKTQTGEVSPAPSPAQAPSGNGTY